MAANRDLPVLFALRSIHLALSSCWEDRIFLT